MKICRTISIALSTAGFLAVSSQAALVELAGSMESLRGKQGSRMLQIASINDDLLQINFTDLAALSELHGRAESNDHSIRFSIDGVGHTYQVESVLRPSGGGTIAFGRGDDHSSYFYMGSSGDSVIAMVVRDGVATRISNCGIGSEVPLDAKSIGHFCDSICLATGLENTVRFENPEPKIFTNSRSGTVIDVLFVYTTEAAVYAGVE